MTTKFSADAIDSRLDEIRITIEQHEDNGGAHKLEDDLWKDALEAIAGRYPEPQPLAKQVLETRDIKFARWYE